MYIEVETYSFDTMYRGNRQQLRLRTWLGEPEATRRIKNEPQCYFAFAHFNCSGTIIEFDQADIARGQRTPAFDTNIQEAVDAESKENILFSKYIFLIINWINFDFWKSFLNVNK